MVLTAIPNDLLVQGRLIVVVAGDNPKATFRFAGAWIHESGRTGSCLETSPSAKPACKLLKYATVANEISTNMNVVEDLRDVTRDMRCKAPIGPLQPELQICVGYRRSVARQRSLMFSTST